MVREEWMERGWIVWVKKQRVEGDRCMERRGEMVSTHGEGCMEGKMERTDRWRRWMDKMEDRGGGGGEGGG